MLYYRLLGIIFVFFNKMGKKLKKGTEGDVLKYVPRTQAIRKLQISLSQFRRLCILKGIYPVEPSNKRKVTGGSTALKTFYYRKDIGYLMHEPILGTLREERVYERKLGKALGKKEFVRARQIRDDKPTYTLDHIIKERYPTFVDALRDLDDGLSMISLFATLPSDEKVSGDHIKECQRLLTEFQHYIVMAGGLQKVFLSIKGIYYQVLVKGQTITWIAPYHFSLNMPHDVDFRVMSTFLEVNETLLGFVNYKLYSDINVMYPPKLDLESFEQGANLSSYVLESKDELKSAVKVKNTKAVTRNLKTLTSKLESIKVDEEVDEEVEESLTEGSDGYEEDAPEPVVEPTTVEESVIRMGRESESDGLDKKIFSQSVFWISREVPLYSLEFVIKAKGGQCGWDASVGAGSPYLVEDSRITHHITDRPLVESTRLDGREYLQPQWIYDSVNKNSLIKTDNYHPGEKLPSHLSPFVVRGEDDYAPDEELEAEEVEEVTITEEEAYAAEIAAEKEGIPFSDFKPVAEAKKGDAAKLEDKEAKELSKILMSKKDKKLYDKIQFGKKRKQDAATKLKEKRKKIIN